MITRAGSRVWWARRRRYRLLLRGHDALFVAFGRLRLRVMKGGRRYRGGS